jgi:hypothetical protein
LGRKLGQDATVWDVKALGSVKITPSAQTARMRRIFHR